MPYKYLYYRIYSWNLRTWGESDVPEYNALFGVSFLAFLNIMSLFTAIELVTGLSIIDDSRMGRLFWFVPFLGVLVASYFFLVGRGRYKQIAKKFSSETTVEKRTRLAALLLYVVGTFAVFFGLISISHS